MAKLLPFFLELLGRLENAAAEMTEAQLEQLQAYALSVQMHLLCWIAQINAAGVSASNNIISSMESLGNLITEIALNTQVAVTPNIPEEWKLTYVLSEAAKSHPAIAFSLSWIGPEFPAFVGSVIAIRLFFRR